MPAPSSDQQAPRPQEIFISYSRKDKEFVRRLDEALKRREREAWVDWEGIPPGDTWEKTIFGGDRGYPYLHLRADTRFDRISGVR